MVLLKNSQNSQENACAKRHIINGISLDFIKKDTLRRCFPVNFANFLRYFSLKHLQWLLLGNQDNELIKANQTDPLKVYLLPNLSRWHWQE